MFIGLFSINLFLLLTIGSTLSPSIITLIHETNKEETNEFITNYLINSSSIITYCITIITILVICYFENKYRYPNRIFKSRYGIYTILIISFCLIERGLFHFIDFSCIFKNKDISSIEKWSFSFDPDTNLATGAISAFYTFSKTEIEISKSIQKTISYKKESYNHTPINIVLVIGESFNKHHSNLYDYNNNTNPYLKGLKDGGHLFVYKDVISPFNLTSLVLKNLFSTNSIVANENWADYPAFPIIFKKSGFHVYYWDNQYSLKNTSISDFSLEAYLHNKILSSLSYDYTNDKNYDFDYDLFVSFKKKTNKIILKNGSNLFIFHLMGQHLQPQKRYPHNKQFQYFTSDSIKRNNLSTYQKQQIAFYDNATRYNDYTIYKIISYFKDTNSVLIYLSDHGEEIYDYRNNMGRTQGKIPTANVLKHQYEIPFLIWYSSTFEKKFPDKIKMIKQTINKPFMIDNTCQILFGLSNLNTKYYHSERDLLSKNFKPYKKRIVFYKFDYDSLRWSHKDNH